MRIREQGRRVNGTCVEPVRIHRIGAWIAALVAIGAQQRRAGDGRRSSRLLPAFLLLAAETGAAAEWNRYASIATDYIYRGISLLDSGPSAQVSMEGRFDQGFVMGAWAANVDRQWSYQYALSSHVELNLFAGMDFGCGSECRARVIVTSYQYPGSDARNWEEATASVSFAERVGASLSWSPRGLGINRSTRTLEGWYVQPLSRATRYPPR